MAKQIRKFNRFFVCGVDGTVDHFVRIGSNMEANQRDYDSKFARSFVRQLCNFGTGSRYFRGPAASGSGLGWAMENAVSAITERYNKDREEHARSKNDWYHPGLRAYVLTGYSRGATGIIEVAKRLKTSESTKNLGIEIYAMILFDCVNETNTSAQGFVNRGGIPGYANPKSIVTGSLLIPSNVQNCVHYMRSDESNSRSDTMAKYEGGPVNPWATSYTPMYFKATHGGLGGLPYFKGSGEGNNIPILEPGSPFATNVTMAEDILASRQVAKHASTFCGSLGLPMSISV